MKFMKTTIEESSYVAVMLDNGKISFFYDGIDSPCFDKPFGTAQWQDDYGIDDRDFNDDLITRKRFDEVCTHFERQIEQEEREAKRQSAHHSDEDVYSHAIQQTKLRIGDFSRDACLSQILRNQVIILEWIRAQEC